MIEREIRVEAPVDRVWAALTDPEALGEWMGPDVEVDLRPGGSYKFFAGDTSGVFVRVMRPNALEYTWRQGTWDPDWEDSIVAWDLRPDGLATTIMLRHGEFPNEAEQDSHAAGWDEYFLEPMKAWLER